MTQKFVYLKTQNLDVLSKFVQDEVQEKNENGYLLKEFKLAEMETDNALFHAFLLFQHVGTVPGALFSDCGV